jgi:cob(I)alamin adenosyltransferase
MTGRLERGLVHVYTGDGKGKTTAALGQAFRASGHDLRVFMILFMKGNIEYGELVTAERLKPLVEIHQMGRETFVSKENPDPVDIEWAQKGLHMARKVLSEDQHDIVILDEINVALDFKLIGLSEVMELIEMKPPRVELILTGRAAHPDVIAAADLVTEMKLVKHYYDEGIMARVGIER